MYLDRVLEWRDLPTYAGPPTPAFPVPLENRRLGRVRMGMDEEIIGLIEEGWNGRMARHGGGICRYSQSGHCRFGAGCCMRHVRAAAVDDGARKLGRVKMFNVEKGFGFIVPDASRGDVYFHRSELPPVFDPVRGVIVEFSVRLTTKGTEAYNIIPAAVPPPVPLRGAGAMRGGGLWGAGRGGFRGGGEGGGPGGGLGGGGGRGRDAGGGGGGGGRGRGGGRGGGEARLEERRAEAAPDWSAAMQAARNTVAAWRPAAVAASRAMGEFELSNERLGRRVLPVGGIRYDGVNSAVLRARHAASGALVAIKVLFTLADEAGGARLVGTNALRELHRAEYELFDICTGRVHAGASLATAHIMAVLKTFQMDMTDALVERVGVDREFIAARTLALVMPLLGRSLQAELAERRERRRGVPAPLYSTAEWAHRALQVAKGLAHLHACHIVHRDVKPDNVMLSRADDAGAGVDDAGVLAVVTDFGECADFDVLAPGGAFAVPAYFPKGGAPAYHSPEVSASDTGRPGAVVDYSGQDAWALGCVLHAMLSPDVVSMFRGRDVPSDFRDELYVDPADARGDGVGKVAVRRIVRDLLRVRVHERMSLAEAVAALEVLVFVVPHMSPPGALAGYVAEVEVAAAMGRVRDDVFTAARAGTRLSVRQVLAADFGASPRSEYPSVARVVRGLLCRA